MARTTKKGGQKIMTDQAFQFLKSYINNASPTGFESGGQKLWLEYVKPYVDTHITDPYGSAAGIINPSEKFKVVIEAHADEISWFVNYITADGLIYLKRNGGVDHQVAPGKRVIVHGRKGPVKAVFGWPAIHTRYAMPDAKEPSPRVDNLFLDCGARSKKEVESTGIHVGAVATYEDGFEELAYGYYIGRAMDNRIGGFMIAEVARLLKQNKGDVFAVGYVTYLVLDVKESVKYRASYVFLDGASLQKREIDSLKEVIVKKANSGVPWAKLSDEYTMDGNNTQGDTGWFFGEYQVPKELQDAVSKHKKDEIFFVEVPERQWYYIVKKTYDDDLQKDVVVLRANGR